MLCLEKGFARNGAAPNIRSISNCMNTSLFRPFLAALAALLTFGLKAEAHPGHSGLDWFSVMPHTGHQNEVASVLAAVALTGVAWGACWLATRGSR